MFNVVKLSARICQTSPQGTTVQIRLPRSWRSGCNVARRDVDLGDTMTKAARNRASASYRLVLLAAVVSSACSESGAPACSTQPVQVCFTAEEIKANVAHPPHWDFFDASPPAESTPVAAPVYSGLLPPKGCPQASELEEPQCGTTGTGKVSLIGGRCCAWFCVYACP